jgi:hypothetical protein
LAIVFFFNTLHAYVERVNKWFALNESHSHRVRSTCCGDVQADGLAALGQYTGGIAGAAGEKSLFVPDHKY